MALRHDMYKANDKAQYDTYAKTILAHKRILSNILVETVDEFHGMQPEEVEGLIEGDIHIGNVPVAPGMTNNESDDGTGGKITGFNTVDSALQEGVIVFDVIFYVRLKDGLSQIIINVEAQKDDPSEYHILNRAIFYTSRMVSSQKDRDFKGQRFNGGTVCSK